MKKLFLMLAIVASALTLTACGGGDDTPQVASADLPLALNATTGITNTAPFIGQSFAFTGGVPDFGTTTSTTVTLTEAPPQNLQPGQTPFPGFKIATAAGTANGVLEFGSCKFRITSSSFTSGPLVAGNVITISNCSFSVNTQGQAADGSAQTRSVRWLLSNAASTGTSVTVSINPGGQVTINGRSTGTVTLTPVTGA
jgi:hypothetical protein